MNINNKFFAHKTSIIDEGAKIGEGTKIWHWSHISSKVLIGEGCSFGQNVFVGNNVKIGNNVKVQNNVSIYDNIVIEDNVFCGPSMVFTNVINPRSEISRKSEYKKTIIRNGATLGANCTVVCGNVIGQYAFVGAGAVVSKNINPFSLVVGVPAVQIGWMSKFGERVDLPIHGRGKWSCPNTGTNYYLKDNRLSIEEEF